MTEMAPNGLSFSREQKHIPCRSSGAVQGAGKGSAGSRGAGQSWAFLRQEGPFPTWELHVWPPGGAAGVGLPQNGAGT